ncbi:MAG TPA: hypothetical protein VJM15_07285 [Sphingomicrobium sp.]|nr:hypothetical protein [Sphingomicrobium sp.]
MTPGLLNSGDAYAFTAITSANKGYSINGLNQYTAVAGSTYSYDANGNLTHDGIRGYVYDGENRLVSVQNGPAFAYDPLGRLVEVSQAPYLTRFLYDGDALVAAIAVTVPLRGHSVDPDGSPEP